MIFERKDIFFGNFVWGLMLLCILNSCKSNSSDRHNHGNDLDTLKVVTLYGPTSYFDYRGQPMGIDYENVRKFAEEEGMILDLHIVGSITDLITELENQTADLAAFPIPNISEYNSRIMYCGPMEITRQVLVQKKGPEMLTDVTQLIGKDIYVEKNSKYEYRLINLNEELGGGINIIPIESDTITSEDILNMVNEGKIPYAVVDSGIADLYKSSYPEIDISMKVSADQSAFWAVAPGLDSLAVKIDRWENKSHSSEFLKEIYKRYYDNNFSYNLDANLSYFKNKKLSAGEAVSPFDELFKKYSATSTFDWELLAAIAYCESRFNPGVQSRFGASGLMQVMPSTAKAMGVDPAALKNPDANIKAASKILSKLNDIFADYIEDPSERMKFVVAAYNSGPGHILDAIALAEKVGLDPQKWLGNVSVAALMKSRPEYYNDPVVKHGYFRGRETVEFVDLVGGIHNYLRSNINSKTNSHAS